MPLLLTSIVEARYSFAAVVDRSMGFGPLLSQLDDIAADGSLARCVEPLSSQRDIEICPHGAVSRSREVDVRLSMYKVGAQLHACCTEARLHIHFDNDLVTPRWHWCRCLQSIITTQLVRSRVDEGVVT